jgi:surfactin synthase thioesterase subunit
MLVDSGWTGGTGLKVLCGGEALGKDLANELLDRASSVWNLYGPTETTIWSTAHRLTRDEGPVLAGRPIANTQVYVLDGTGRPVPTGAPGELYIGGDGVARGYLGREQLTAERFVPDPYSGKEGARMYRTGDLARYRAGGALEVLGRLDHQVKVRGFRIELGEIETVLATHGGVRQAVAIVREDRPGDRRLVAYFIAEESSKPEPSELRSHLKDKLPEYMIPSAFVELSEFPLTPNGKVNRAALPEPERGRSEQERTPVAPRTPAELLVAEIWAEVLGVDGIGVHDDFFELGGHSLLGLRVLSKLEKATGQRIELVELFQGRTVEHLARFVSGEDKGATSPIVALRAAGTKLPFFAGGSNPLYLDVARNLESQRPFYKLDVYAMQSQRVAQGLKPHGTIEEIALEFIEGMRRVQPSGPYLLGGACEGAFVAFEIATELQKRGESIAGLIVWVTPAPRYGSSSRFLRVINQARGLLRRGNVLQMSTREMVGLLRHEYLEYQIFKTMDQYQPRRPYDGRMVLLRTTEGQPGPSDDRTLGWGKLASEGVDVHALPGTHKTWLVDHLPEFSRILDSQLGHVMGAPHGRSSGEYGPLSTNIAVTQTVVNAS